MRTTETKVRLQQLAAQCAEVELYVFASESNTSFHTDSIHECYSSLDSLPDEVECRWEVMNEEEYGDSILANTDLSADFADWYGDSNAKVLVIGLYEEPVIIKTLEDLEAYLNDDNRLAPVSEWTVNNAIESNGWMKLTNYIDSATTGICTDGERDLVMYNSGAADIVTHNGGVDDPEDLLGALVRYNDSDSPILVEYDELAEEAYNAIKASAVREVLEGEYDDVMPRLDLTNNNYVHHIHAFDGGYYCLAEDFTMMTNRERIGARIAELRKEKNMTIDQLSELSGIHRSNISKIENGRYNVSVDILNKLCNALNVQIELN